MAGTKVASAGITRTPLTALSTDYVGVDTGGTPTKIALPFLLNAINVKAYGAKGDTRQVTDAVLNGTTTVTSATAAFTAADVGKVVWGIEQASGIARLTKTTVASVTNATTIVVGSASAGDYTGVNLVLGTDDTAALQAAFAASLAASPAPPPLYHPTGGYIVSSRPFNYTGSVGPAILGDGPYETTFYPTPDLDYTALGGTNKGVLVNTTGNMGGLHLENFGVNFSGYLPTAAGGPWSGIYDVGTVSRLRNLFVQRFGPAAGGYVNYGIFCIASQAVYERVNTETCGTGMYFTDCGVTCIDCESHNCKQMGTQVVGVVGSANNYGRFFHWFGGVIDESTSYSLVVDNASDDVTFFGAKIFGPDGSTANFGARVQGNSTVKFFGCEIVDYGNSGASRSGLGIASGSIVYASGCRFTGVGTGVGIRNEGTFYDLGGNTIDIYAGAGGVVANGRRTVGTAVTVANTTMTNLSDLTFTVGSGTRVSGRAAFFADDATAADGIKFDLDGGTATFTSFIAQYRLTDGAGVVTVARTTAIATDAAVATFTNAGLVEIEFSGVVNAAGTLIPRVAKNSGSTGNVTVSAGSNMILNGLAN